MKKLLKPGVIILLLAITHSAIAKDYDVELIIFERTSSTPLDMENASLNYQLKIQQELRALARKVSDIKTTNLLDKLKNIQQHLLTSGHTILKSARWTQPGEIYQHAPVLKLGDETSKLQQGYIRIYKTQLIFADIRIMYVPANASTSMADLEITNEASIPRQFFLSEKRRLKFKEIHYFDHPYFGIILGVWSNKETKINAE